MKYSPTISGRLLDILFLSNCIICHEEAFRFTGASLVAQLVKSLPATQETTLVGSHAAEKATKSECGRISKATDVILYSAFWMCNTSLTNRSVDAGTNQRCLRQ